MIKINITNEAELMNLLTKDIEKCEKDRIVLQAGHFPLLYCNEGAIEAIDEWGHFSRYTLELACQLGNYARDIGKEVEFTFWVDDKTYRDRSKLNHRQMSQIKKILYQGRSGKTAELPSVYKETMKQYGFSEKDVIRNDHNKPGRKDCLYFSELILSSSKREIANFCARAYVEFVEDLKYFDKSRDYLVSFITQRCLERICDVALDEEIEGLSASHIFMETMALGVTKEQFYSVGRGVIYRKD